jgi:hypothetical protein
MSAGGGAFGDARAFAVETMDCGHLVDVRQQAVYKTLRRFRGPIPRSTSKCSPLNDLDGYG